MPGCVEEGAQKKLQVYFPYNEITLLNTLSPLPLSWSFSIYKSATSLGSCQAVSCQVMENQSLAL